MRHFIIGASGQIGEFLVNNLSKKNEETIGTFNNTHPVLNGIYKNKILPGKLFKLDISDKNKVKQSIEEINPDVIYVPAANTNVDYCELNELETNKTNINGIINIVDALNSLKIKKAPLLVFYSTDYIFDGKQGLYSENSIINPLNIYGKQKINCEEYIKNNYLHFIIIRTTGVFGPESQGKNFVSRLVKNLRDGKNATISDDEFGTPTYAPNIAEITLKLVNSIGFGLRNEKCNIINVAGRSYISRYQFALDIAKTFNCNSNLISPIKSEELKRPANRPLLGGLDVELVENLIGKNVYSHIDGLIEMKKYL